MKRIGPKGLSLPLLEASFTQTLLLKISKNLIDFDFKSLPYTYNSAE
jgi:hypothetical protein